MTLNIHVLFTLSKTEHFSIPCQVCRQILQNGKLHCEQTTKSELGSETIREPHVLRGQNIIPGIESKHTSSLK